MKTNEKIVLYVQSSGIDTLGAVDREGGTFGCARAWRPFLGLKKGTYFHDRYYSDADWEALMIAEKLHENTGVEIEVVDISKHISQRIRLLLKGSMRTPQFIINGEKLPSITSVDQLASFF